ncbi:MULTISPECIES: DUF6290 family protein [Tetragenococcus]|uniref:CopG family transcriptional regulator n=2 Tax=Tetragenococcus muriaticus TaxID=64642 RepID=A0A091C291_9ENTE|nr:DUF6290 family protein [Tetragenococcus muriaticus]KFN90182.1 hypothetical protein TMU3MR103_1629 [Tetragenococcus muriaticus 3MR10-3]KFN90597.1 hypothetical protein TMUPMC115_1851 [Tetragenococcus muriaticus PMC-11-5]GMA46051.1 hypothetical protein GCM10025854_03000 [Tetragenococcus muriaticus]GMA47353.1 hypothetical protein GCM10025854_16030 [Tetragenococcus muriaticus]
MVVTSLRFKDEQYQEIKELAEFEGVFVTTFMRQTILGRLQDEKGCYEAVQSLEESNGESVSSDEIKRRLGMARQQIIGKVDKEFGL